MLEQLSGTLRHILLSEGNNPQEPPADKESREIATWTEHGRPIPSGWEKEQIRGLENEEIVPVKKI